MEADDFTLPDVLDGISVKKRGELKRATEVVRRIEDARVDITGNLGASWESIGWALSYFEEEGRELYHRVSALAQDYNRETTSEQFDKELAKTKKPNSPGGFFKHAKACGVDVSIKVKMEGVKGEEKDDEDKLKENWVKDLGGNLEDWRAFGLWEQDGCYWSLTEKMSERPITNFVMRILYHLRLSRSEAYKIIHIKNVFGYEHTIEMNTDDFVSTGAFRKCLLRYGHFLFKGTDFDLHKLHDKLLREDKDARPIRSLGYDKKSGLWFFANGLCECTRDGHFKPVDQFGIIEHNQQHFYIPAMSKINEEEEEENENDKRFIYQKATVSFETWASIFCKVYGRRGWMAIAFWWSALHFDVFKPITKGFPILNFYGQKSSGKGAMAESLMKLFGLGQNQLMLGGPSTVKGMMRKLANLKNSLVWFDEFKNSIDPKIIETLKNIWDRIGYERAATDNTSRTKGTSVNSAVILSGQEMPTGEPALFSRVIFLQFDKLTLTDQARELFAKLSSIEQAGISSLTIEALSFRPDIEEKIQSYFEQELAYVVKESKGGENIERITKNYSLILASARVLAECMKVPFTMDEFRTYTIELMKAQLAIASGTDDLKKFWEIVEMLFNRGFISEGADFEIEDGKLYIRLINIYSEYAKELRMRNDPNLLAKPTLENYLQNDSRTFIDKRKKMFSNGSYTHTWVFNYALLDINLIRAATKEDAQVQMEKHGVNVAEYSKEKKAFQASFQEALGESENLDF